MDSGTGTCRESPEPSLAQLAIGLEFPLGLTIVQLLPRPDLLPTAAAPKDTASRLPVLMVCPQVCLLGTLTSHLVHTSDVSKTKQKPHLQKI